MGVYDTTLLARWLPLAIFVEKLAKYQFRRDTTPGDLSGENLGIQYDILRIEELYHEYLSLLKPIFKDLPFNN